MTLAIQSNTETITAWEIIPRLAHYQMLPQLIKESIIDEAIKTIECSPAEITSSYQIFEKQNKIQTAAQRQEWAATRGMSEADIREVALRQLKIAKFKHQQWGHTTKSYFIARKAQLDKVSFSIIRTKDQSLAQEIYFRIQEQEQTFAELARQFSQGVEADLGGFVAPIELGSLPPAFAQLLQNRQAGDLLPPCPTADSIVIIQINSVISAKLDSLTNQRLLNEQFQRWLQQQIKKHSIALKNLQLN